MINHHCGFGYSTSRSKYNFGFLPMAKFNYFWSGPIPGPHQPAYSPVQPPVNPTPASTVTEHVNLDLKVLSPMNKKDYRMFVLRHVSTEIDSPCKFRDEIIRQYGETVKLDPDMEIGYFHHSQKIWISSRLDVMDMWSLISSGERVTFWCVGKESLVQASKKRPPNHEKDLKYRKWKY